MSDEAQVAETLSKRELEVATAYADGASYKEIARDLGISPTTVRSHLRTVYGKLNVTSKIALAQTLADPVSSAADADDNLAFDLALELDEAIRRERAMARVLRIISKSDTSIEDVIDEVLDHALEICEAEFGILMEHHGDYTFTEMRSRNISPAFAKWLSEQGAFNPGPETAVGRSARDLQPVSIADVGGEGISWDENPLRMATVEYGRARSLAAIPMTAGGRLIGVFSVYRTRVHPFNDRSLELAQAFADQAAIALENVRQFREVQERLEREKASAEILDVISQSRDNQTPVFQAILERAERLCDATASGLQLVNEDRTRLRYVIGSGPDQGSFTPGETTWDLDGPYGMCAAVRDACVMHMEDMKNSDLYRSGDPSRVALVDVEGVNTQLHVPLLKDGVAFGNMSLSRREQKPFTPDQIALMETFAAQAVIAIENVRQFREVQARLEREAASAEILGVISTSRDDEKPVFDVILEQAARLCRSPQAGLIMPNEARTHVRYTASWGPPTQHFEVGVSEWQIDEPLAITMAISEGRTVNIPDTMKDAATDAANPSRMEIIEKEGIRSVLAVPLMMQGEAIGCFDVYRTEVDPFSDDDVALMETFAAQAVIAIENVRQFREVQERLERERASAEILEVISKSRDDEKPVFDAILENTAKLCETDLATLNLMNEEGTHLEYAAHFGRTLHTYEVGVDRWSLDSTLQIAESVREARIVHNVDLRETQLYVDGDPWRRQLADEEGVRSFLTVPLMAPDGKPVGCIGIYRKEIRAFSSDEISMVETFAAQAVIAIENVRQFREVQERLERERASAEILEIISQSRDDDKPVFDAILKNACNLCNAPQAALILGAAKDDIQSMAANVNVAAAAVEMFRSGKMPMDGNVSYAARSIIEARLIAFDDMRDSDLYAAGSAVVRSMVDDSGIRSVLFVPLIKDAVAIGNITLFRYEVDPFNEFEISLIETFAAQAVIAIENVRQFKALETLNAELGDRVQDQVGEIERMGRLKRFLPAAVADAVVTSGDESMLTSHRAMVATLFCDMRGFTAFCEAAEPEETIEVLQTYHQEMSDLIDEYGGGVDQRAGDGIMVIFNDPIPVDDPAGDAVRLAVAMREKMKELCAKWKRLGHRLGFGVGISLGYATVGMVGSAGRFDYTASGTSVNTAARLCDMAADGEILISPRVWVAVEGDFHADSRGEVEMKGIREPVEVFSITNKQDTL